MNRTHALELVPILPGVGMRSRFAPTAARIVSVLCLLAYCVAAASAEVIVDVPWVRATVEGQTATAAYMTLTSSRDLVLIGVSSSISGRASIHEMKMADGMMSMRPVKSVPLTAGSSIVMSEGHHHVMLEALKRPLHAGDIVPLSLVFADSKGHKEVVPVLAPVKPLAPGCTDGNR